MFAALHLPNLEIDAALRVSPEARGEPCAVISGKADPDDPKNKLPLLAANTAAKQTGIAAGWPLNRALVRCPALRILASESEAKAMLLHELIGLAESVTADLEITAPGTLVLDLSHTPRRKVALLEEFEILHAELWHARAETPDLAHLAALHEESQGETVSPALFSQLPIHLLSPLPGVAEVLPMLRRWGLRSLGDFMKLPRQELADRLGPVAAGAHDILHGKTRRLLRLHRPPESFAQSYDFEDEVYLVEPIIFSAKRLLHTLSSRIAASYLAVNSLHLALRQPNGQRIDRTLRLPEPLTDAADLLKPIQTYLESLQLKAPVASVAIEAHTVSPSAFQREWLGRQLPNPNGWSDTLARLEALLGTGRVGIPVSENTHRPDAFRLLPPLSPQGEISLMAEIRNSVPLRRFRPPRPINVAFDSSRKTPDPLALLNGPHPGQILATHGPFPLSGNWWDEGDSWHQLEWDVELASHHLVRLSFIPPDHWQLEGIYA